MAAGPPGTHRRRVAVSLKESVRPSVSKERASSLVHTVLHEGWCTKESGKLFLGKRNWKRRWFKLVKLSDKSVHLEYYKNDSKNDAEQLGTVTLDTNYCVYEVEGSAKPHPNCFSVGPIIDERGTRTYFISCLTQAEMLKWMTAIDNAIQGILCKDDFQMRSMLLSHRIKTSRSKTVIEASPKSFTGVIEEEQSQESNDNDDEETDKIVAIAKSNSLNALAAKKLDDLLKNHSDTTCTLQNQQSPQVTVDQQEIHLQKLEKQLKKHDELVDEKQEYSPKEKQDCHTQQQLEHMTQKMHKEIQNLTQEKQKQQRLLQQQRQEIQLLQQQNLKEQNRLQQQSWIININEINVLDKELGVGAYGWVKEATFRSCKVAVKCLHKELISNYNLHIFNREMTMAARCRHPNLLQFVGATYTDEGVPYIVTEVMYTSLRKVLIRDQLSSGQIVPVATGIACGLNYLHKTTPVAILHRDVSSANVLLNPLPDNQWLPKLSDFGSFNFMKESKTVNAGNPAYAAPEALDSSKGPHTPAMDTFSFGVLLHEMCSRMQPTQEFSAQIMLQQVSWRAPERNLIPLIIDCADEEIKKRPSMDKVIAMLNNML